MLLLQRLQLVAGAAGRVPVGAAARLLLLLLQRLIWMWMVVLLLRVMQQRGRLRVGVLLQAAGVEGAEAGAGARWQRQLLERGSRRMRGAMFSWR